MATGFLSPSSVARLRARAVAGFDATCTVRERATTSAPWTPIAALTDLRCAFAAEAATNESVAADATIATTRFVVRFDPDALPLGTVSIKSTHQLVITHQRPGIPSPLTLTVVGDQPRGEYEITRHVIATRTTAGG